MEAWRAYEAEKERLANLKDAPGGKVYMAHYGQCEYNCLQELIQELRHERDSRSWGSLFLVDIVKYNVRFRDCLRNTGIEGVMEMMTEECPSLATEEEELGKLLQWALKILSVRWRWPPSIVIFGMMIVPIHEKSTSRIRMDCMWDVYGRATQHLTPLTRRMAGATTTLSYAAIPSQPAI